jgi:hypothetical protein
MDTSSPPAKGGWTIGLRNWRVRSKLIAVLVIPAVAFLVLASFGIGALVGNAQAFEEGRRLAELGRQVTALVHELQAERDLSAAYIGSADKGVGDAVGKQLPRTNQAVTAYRTAEDALYDDLGDRAQSRLDAAGAALDNLSPLRDSVRRSSLTRRAVFAEYSRMVDRLLDVNAGIGEPGGDEDLSQSVRALNDLSQAKEVTSQLRGILYALAFQDEFEFGGFQEFSGLLAQQRAAFEEFQADANVQEQALFADIIHGQAVLQVERIEQGTVRQQSGADIDADQWLNASTTYMELLRSVESRLLEGVVGESGDLSATAQRDALRNALIIAAILGIALLALLLVARSMGRPLQQLRAGAIEIAQNRLPEAVQRLRTTERGELDVRVEPIGIDSRDEIGQVAQAVDDIQEVAVRLASEQSALRRSIGDMFTNLARRSQTLIDRQLELIDDLERNETDPETLEHLFRLDHLATRMRRNAEDLIVLSGADPGRHWAQPMTVVDVVRAAAAEVEEYQRVELLPLADLEVAGHVAVDVIHLLAELIENATAFSPPNTKVQIAGQAVPHGYVIEVEDRGLGMSDEELIQANARLANPPEIDFALSRVLGLYVVGRLGQRHGIKVQLRHSWYGGVTALTLLPNALLVWPKVPQVVAADRAAAAAPGIVQGRGELPPPGRPVEPEPGPAGDSTPIFDAARSDWFVTEPSEQGPLPSRAHRQRGADGDGRPVAPPSPPPRPAAAPPPMRTPEPPPAVAPEPPPYRPEPARPEPVRAAADEFPPQRAERPGRREQPPVPPAPAPAAPDPAERLTQAGLPRRVPRTNMAPEMVASQQAGAEPAPSAVAGRSPEEVRSMLSSYRTGIERGRTVAGGSDEGDHPSDAS